VRPGGLAEPWSSDEFAMIAEVQARLEDGCARDTPVPWLVCDTDVLATAVWHERYVGSRSPSIEKLAKSRVPHLYVLTLDDIPFVQDGLRDGEHMRSWMTQRFREVLSGVRALEVNGPVSMRLRSVLNRIHQGELEEALSDVGDTIPQAGQFREHEVRMYRAGLAWVEKQPHARSWHRSAFIAAMMDAGERTEIAAGMILTPLSRVGVIESVDRGHWRFTGKIATPEELLAYWLNPDGYPGGPRMAAHRPHEVPAPLCAVCGTNHPGEC
jgi:hypothetical protein